MSVRQYTRAQLHWYAAGYGLIVRRARKHMQEQEHNDNNTMHFLWRIGLNEYLAGQYESSILHLKKLLNMLHSNVDTHGVTVERKLTKYEVTHKSTIHQIIGKCSMFLFLQNRKHEQLVEAYTHYQTAVSSVVVSLTAMIELPRLLVEFGIVLEMYGAFEAALDAYSKVLVRFPTFRGYFDALYRTAIVGRHLASLSSDAKQQEEVLEKSVDILQFLLEALPTNIQDVS
jgi:tetratricopeptide (TPR) repeat protein